MRLFLSSPHLQKGNLDEINVHLSSFHNYRPPSYTEDVWEPVNEDRIRLTLRDRNDCAPPADPESLSFMAHCNPASQEFPPQSPSSFRRTVSPYCSVPSSEVTPPWPGGEVASPQGVEYTTLGQLGPQLEAAAPTKRSPQDFYTCVQLMNESGEVHLVPCLPPQYCQDAPAWSTEKMADYQLRADSAEAQGTGSANPLVSVALDNQG